MPSDRLNDIEALIRAGEASPEEPILRAEVRAQLEKYLRRILVGRDDLVRHLQQLRSSGAVDPRPRRPPLPCEEVDRLLAEGLEAVRHETLVDLFFDGVELQDLQGILHAAGPARWADALIEEGERAAREQGVKVPGYEELLTRIDQARPTSVSPGPEVASPLQFTRQFLSYLRQADMPTLAPTELACLVAMGRDEPAGPTDASRAYTTGEVFERLGKRRPFGLVSGDLRGAADKGYLQKTTQLPVGSGAGVRAGGAPPTTAYRPEAGPVAAALCRAVLDGTLEPSPEVWRALRHFASVLGAPVEIVAGLGTAG